MVTYRLSRTRGRDRFRIIVRPIAARTARLIRLGSSGSHAPLVNAKAKRPSMASCSQGLDALTFI